MLKAAQHVLQWLRSLDWRAIWQAAIPLIIAGVILKLVGG
jgi:hypothetical protein